MKSMLFCLVLIFLSDASRALYLLLGKKYCKTVDVTSSCKYSINIMRLSTASAEGRKEGLINQIEFRRVQELSRRN